MTPSTERLPVVENLQRVLAPRVLILMSTYQGERFVAEQLRSILDQLPEHGRIRIRDDGSQDGTVAALSAIDDPRIELECGHNLGFAGSFLKLLSAAPVDVDMVMFADQDDVWLPGKIERAWSALRGFGDEPALYGSAQRLVDAELRPIGRSPRWRRAPGFKGALAENKITGCTAAFNQPALRLLQRAAALENVHFHDWWLYVVVSAFGSVVVDPEPTLLYRQHVANQIGQGAQGIKRLQGWIAFLRRRDWVGILLCQVHALWVNYGESLPPQRMSMLQSYFELSRSVARPRWRLIFSLGRWRDGVATELPFRLLLLAHRLNLWPVPSRRLRLTATDESPRCTRA